MDKNNAGHTKVKRYDLKERVRGMESWYQLEEDPDGDYVSFEDYDSLQQQNRELVRVLKLVERVFGEGYSTLEQERYALDQARAALQKHGKE